MKAKGLPGAKSSNRYMRLLKAKILRTAHEFHLKEMSKRRLHDSPIFKQLPFENRLKRPKLFEL